MPWNPAVWIAANWLYLTGWSILGVVIWRFHKVMSRFEKYGENINSLTEDMESIKTNHLVHIQAELERSNTTLEGIRQDFKDGTNRLNDVLNVVLVRLK